MDSFTERHGLMDSFTDLAHRCHQVYTIGSLGTEWKLQFVWDPWITVPKSVAKENGKLSVVVNP